jgi:hypothetical protein
VIDQVDDNLSNWVETILGGLKPSLSAPTEANGTLAVNLYLLELVDDPLRRNTSRPPLQPALRYLVTSSAEEPKDAHRLLGTLLMAALNNPSYEVELEPVPHNTWSAFKIAPRPSFILRVPLEREWPISTVPLVTEGAATQGAPMLDMHGVLLGPNDVPIANGRIEIPNLYRYTYTDSKGRFQLNGVPASPRVKTLRIMARNRELTVHVAETGAPDRPVNLKFDLFNDFYGLALTDETPPQPIPNARIELPALHRITFSDDQGRFRFIGVAPGQSYDLVFTIKKGQIQQKTTLSVSNNGSKEKPVEVRIALNSP